MVSSCMLVGDSRIRFLMRRSVGGRSLLHSLCLNLIVGLEVSLTRPYFGIYPVVSRVGCVCYTSDAKVCPFVRRVETFLHAPYWDLSRRSSGEEFLLHTRWRNVSGRW